MARFTRSTLAAAAVVVTAAALVAAPAAQAATGSPLTFAQLQSDPGTVAANASMEKFLDGNFTLTGTQYDSKGGTVVAERLVHKGGMYRIAATRPGLGTRVVISDGSRSCVRTATKAANAAPSKDRAARWSCKNGVDTLLSGELLAITPIGMGQVLDAQTDGLIRFVPRSPSGSAYQMDLTSATGVKAGAFRIAGPAGGPISVTIVQGNNDFVAGKFVAKAGATGAIPSLASLKK